MLAGVLYDALPIPAPFVGARHGVPDDDDHSNALLGSRILPSGLLLAFSRKVNLLVILFPLPMGAHRFLQSVCVQDS